MATFLKRCLLDITSHTRPRSAETVIQSLDMIDFLVSDLLLDKFKPKLQEPEFHALSVLGRVSKDQRFDEFRQTDFFKAYEDVMEKLSTPISEYADQWTLDMQGNQKELENKLEELAWTYTVLYGLSGWTEGQIR